MTGYELGIRKLTEFLKENEVGQNFNEKQKIVLIASNFDIQTLSAVAWLNSNNVDISCIKLIPYKINDDVFIETEKVLPLDEYNSYYVDLLDKSVSGIKRSTGIKRKSLPRIDSLLDWGVVKAGDIIIAKGKDNEAELLKNGNVMVNGHEKSMQVWLKELYGWASIQTFVFAVHKETGKTLFQIREEFMEKQAGEVTD